MNLCMNNTKKIYSLFRKFIMIDTNTIIFMLNIYFFLNLKLIQSTNEITQHNEKSLLDQNQVTCNNVCDLTDNIFDLKALNEKQNNYILYLCYTVIYDIGSLMKIANISKTFKHMYETKTYLTDSSGRIKFKITVCFNKETLNTFQNFFLKDDIGPLQTLYKRQCDNLIYEITNINVMFEQLNDTLNILQLFNKNSFKTIIDYFNTNIETGKKYSKKLKDVFDVEIPIFIKKICCAKKKYSMSYAFFINDVSTTLQEYNNKIYNVIAVYEQEMTKHKYKKCLVNIKKNSKHCYILNCNKCISEIIGCSTNTSVVSISQSIYFIGNKLYEMLCRAYNCSQSENDGINSFIEKFSNALNKFNASVDEGFTRIINMLDKPADYNITNQVLKCFNNNTLFVLDLNKINNLEPNENNLFNINVIKLFKLNMRSLIILKIMSNAIEYFRIYNYEYLRVKKFPSFDRLTINDIPKNHEKMVEIQNNLDSGEYLLRFNDDDKLLLYKYFLYQEIKNELYEKNEISKNLYSSMKLFEGIENKILNFYIDLLTSQIENEDIKMQLHDILLLEYEEEYLKLALVFERVYFLKFMRLPIKLKCFIN